MLYFNKCINVEIEACLKWDGEETFTVQAAHDKIMYLWEGSNPKLVQFMDILSIKQEKGTKYSKSLNEMEVAMWRIWVQ